MNILLFSADNNSTNGSFVSLMTLASHLQENKNNKVFIILPKDGDGNNLLEEKDIDYYVIRSFGWVRKINRKKTFYYYIKEFIKQIINIFAIFRITIFIYRNHIDIVHINDIGAYVGALSSLLLKCPFIWHIRFFMEEDQGCELISKTYGYKLMGKAAHIIAISNSIRNKFSKLIQTNSISTIYNGVDQHKYKIDGHNILCNNQINLLIIGAIRETKGQYQAIKACEKLHSKYRFNIKLKIVGSGKQRDIDAIRTLIYELNADSFIELCGPTSDTVKYYKESDIFLMCSQAEPFGRVTVEAMMAGCLVIGANSMGTSEIITDGETGYLYENKNISDLTKKIINAIIHPDEARRIAKKGQSYALSNFTSEKNAKDIYHLYEQLLSN